MGLSIKLNFSITVPDWLTAPFIALALLYRRIWYGYPFRRIPLTQGKYAIVDPEDYERINKHKWYAVNMKHTFYAQRGISMGDKRVLIMMHREILKVTDGKFCDHINHNGLDNRKANLRPATRSQNSINKPFIKTKPSSSKYRGVSWSKSQKKWHVQVGLNGKYKFIGYFHNEVAAARAYDAAAKKFHGEFAVLNFPPHP